MHARTCDPNTAQNVIVHYIFGKTNVQEYEEWGHNHVKTVRTRYYRFDAWEEHLDIRISDMFGMCRIHRIFYSDPDLFNILDPILAKCTTNTNISTTSSDTSPSSEATARS